MFKQNYRMLALLLVIALMLACAPVAVATQPAPPTFDPLSLNTIIAQTAGAAATQTFVLLPTLTPEPTITKTPTEVPSSTPTFLFVLFTPTVPSSTPTIDTSTSTGRYACRIVSQNPGDNEVLARGIPFKAHWQVINTGTLGWDSNTADYRYVNGDKLHRKGIFDFEESVASGGVIDLFVEMQAPTESGTYTTTWRIALGKERFCSMKVTIVVK